MPTSPKNMTIGLVLKANDNKVSESFWLRHRDDGNTFLLLTRCL